MSILLIRNALKSTNITFTNQVNIRCVVVSIFFSVAQQPLVGQDLLIIEASRSHLDARYSVGLLWTSDQPAADTSA
jgi:hypothetical protein